MFRNINYAATIKKTMSALLIVVLFFTLFPGISGIAYGEVSTAVNGFVEDIFLYENAFTGPGLKDYNFNRETTEYNVIFPDSRLAASRINITIPQDKVEEGLCFAFLIGGEAQNIQNSSTVKTTKIHSLTQQTTQFGYYSVFTTKNFPVGEKRDFVIRVGKYDEETETWGEHDDYTYHVTRSLTLNKSSGFKVDNADIFPTYDPQVDPYTDDYAVVIGEATTISLTLKPTTTKGTKIYVGTGDGRAEFTSGQAETVDVTQFYVDEDSKIAEIPITLEYGESESKLTRTYKLYAVPQSYSPEITTEPSDTTVNKGEATPLSVTANVPNGTEGALTYQWYRGTSPITGSRISGATEATYQPPSIYAGLTTYCCVVTNTVGKMKFSVTSKAATYTVNLNKLTAPEFVAQPFVDGNEDSNIFVQNQTPTLSFRLTSDSHGNPIEGADYEFSVYRNQTNSTSVERSEFVDAVVNPTSSLGSSSRTYNAVLNSQDVTGSWYYFIVVKATKDNLEPDTETSNTVKLIFKNAGDVVTGLEGTGSAENPFLVNNIDDLKYVRDMVNGTQGKPYSFEGQTLKLTGSNYDLGADWEPIGTLKEGCTTEANGVNILPFSGIIDGMHEDGTVAQVTSGENGKPLLNYARKATVRNIAVYGKIKGYGLVDNYTVDYGEKGQYVNDPVRLRTIDIENVTIKSRSKILKAGFIGGYASGVNAVNIRNCEIEHNVVIGDDGTWGDLGDTSYGYGFVSGWFNHQDNIGSFAGAFNGTITNSVSYATVYGRKNVGGLVGMKGQSMGSCDILNSSFQGTINATGDRVGGIVGAGYISSSAPGTPTVEVHNCFVKANIKGNDKVGGIVGSEEGHEKFNDTGDSYGIAGALSVSDNHFYGTLETTGSNVGGILGYVHDFTKRSGEATNFYLDSCGAKSAIGGAIEGSIVGDDKYGAAASENEFSGGDVLTKLNSSKTSFQNWEQGTSYPVITNDPVVTSLSLEGEYKTEYVLGEALDLTGLEIYANWSDGNKTKLDLEKDGVIVSGYDKNTRGMQTITFQYKAIKGTLGVTVLKPVTDPNQKITVKFTMYGDKIHGDVAEGETAHTLSSGNLDNWITTEEYQIGVNDTLWNLLQKVEEKHSKMIKFHNQGNYIDYLYYDSSNSGKFDNTTKIGEFTNGKLSGWMYTLNETHPLLGVEEQFLNNNDRIVFHYTDDYTKEEGSDKWNTPADGQEVTEVTTSGSSGSATTTTPTEVAVSGSTATATVKAEHVTELLKQAKENKSEEIVMQVAASASKGAETVKLQLDVSAVNSIVNTTSAVVTVSTENGNVTLDREILKQAVSEGNGSTITLEVVKPKTVTAEQKKAAGENAYIIQLVLKSGGKTISTFNKGQATVKVEVPTRLLDKKVAAVHIGDGSVLEQLAGKLLTEGTKKYYEFTTLHFSTFALVDADEAGLEVTDDEQAKLEKLISGVKNTKLKARSAKTSKGIKITWTKSKGYKMDYYEIFRSTKRSKGYGKKAFFSTKSTKNPAKQRYTNTKNLKKGTRYYYKVRGVRVLDGKKYYSQWSTKTWRTA